MFLRLPKLWALPMSGWGASDLRHHGVTRVQTPNSPSFRVCLPALPPSLRLPRRGYRLQLFIALEFRGQPTTHSAAQDLLYKSLPIT